MPRTGLEKKKYGASKYEVALEPALDLSSYERGDAEVVEAEVVDFIDNYDNDEYEDKIYIPPSNKERGGIGRA